MPEGFNTFTYLGHDHYECQFCGECFCGDDVAYAYHQCEGMVEKLYLCNHCGKIFDVAGIRQHSRDSLNDDSTCQCEYFLIFPFTNQEIIEALESARNYKCQDCDDCSLNEKCWVNYVKDASNYMDFEDRIPSTYKCIWDTILDLVKARKEQGINITKPIQE